MTVASKVICPIRRGGPLDRFRYLTSSGVAQLVLTIFNSSHYIQFLTLDERLLEYDVDHVVADVQSTYPDFQYLKFWESIGA